MTRCPRCSSENVIGIRGEWECFDCGFRFKTAKASIFYFKSIQDVLRLVTMILFIAAILLFVYAVIVTNVLGPIQVRVVQTNTTTQLATLSLVSSPPTEIPVGSDLDLIVRLNVDTSFSGGSLVVEVTATDFTPTSSDVSATYRRSSVLCGYSHGWANMIAQNIEGGVRFRGEIKFICQAGENGDISIKVNFKTPNPTSDGKYLIKVWIET